MIPKPSSSCSKINKSPNSFTRFSDYKSKTISTAERARLEDNSSDSQISEFKMTDRTHQQEKNTDGLCHKDIKLNLLTFASVKYKQGLQKRILSLLNIVQKMTCNLSSKKQKRRQVLYSNKDNKKPLKSSKKLTFQILGQLLKNDQFFQQLIIQQKRLQQVADSITQLHNIAKAMKGGFSEPQIIDLMSRINRIQQYCQFLYKVVEELQNTYIGVIQQSSKN